MSTTRRKRSGCGRAQGLGSPLHRHGEPLLQGFSRGRGRFTDPSWPDLSHAKIFRLAFRDKGRLIDSVDHPLFQKWASRDEPDSSERPICRSLRFGCMTSNSSQSQASAPTSSAWSRASCAPGG